MVDDADPKPKGRRVAAAKAPPKSNPKTAVIMVHGMGEQRPLETIRSFVEGVYQQDRSKAAKPDEQLGPLTISVVPDSAFKSAELRRLTTQGDGPKKRTDFFEFYWADIMDGTPSEMVSAWINGLLLRAPWQVPAHFRIYFAWFLLWALAAVVVIAAIATAYPQVADHLGFLTIALDWVAQNREWVGKVLFAIGAVVALYAIGRGVVTKGMAGVRIVWGLRFIVAGLVVSFWPEGIHINAHLVAAGITAGVAWFMHSLVAPYLGDVVRYVRATPSTVERRRLVRERGLALLEAIHERRADSTEFEDFTRAPDSSPPAYDRIVLVGHSLGTYVAYDMLQLFWEKHGPTHHQAWDPGATGVKAALEGVDTYVKKEWVAGQPDYEVEEYVKAQEALQKELGASAPQWRITDFITLGSPLAHAEFLATDGKEDLEAGFVARRFASCPPRPDPLRGSMLYDVKNDGPKYPHFAAQFAAVKWTNICDESLIPILGDLVSGRLRDIFGHGIDEHMVQIKRPRMIWPLNRVFTHTQYWSWDESYADPPPSGLEQEEGEEPQKSNLPKHLEVLRNALRLGT